MLMDSNFGRSFLFLTDLAWKIRVALPALILVGSMVFDFRWEIEINIHTERIALPDGPRQQRDAGGEVGGVGVAIDQLSSEDDDYYEDDDYDDFDDDSDDLMFAMDDLDEDLEEDEGEGDGEQNDDGHANGTIRITRYAIVNIHNTNR
ncbi:uncharacterized protein LOC131209907 [Anopheles bellator]|uniref:uncharacterized protein LOC131209907 n=1 Tax=Anopheles bellator TaxID=139047 RepID=UPI00264795E0|nr:uncharacterized protein LOC131209907 [Anopheles bellator]